MADLVLRDDEQVVASVAWTDDEGNAADVPANAALTSSDDSILTVTDNGDGTWTVATTGQLATGVELSPSGDGIVNSTPATIDVGPSAAVAGGVSFGTPSVRPDVNPNPSPTPEPTPTPTPEPPAPGPDQPPAPDQPPPDNPDNPTPGPSQI